MTAALGRRRGALSADLRRFYGVPLHAAVREWPAAELANAIQKLPPDSALVRDELGDLADWSMLASNVADLVDLMTYWLNSEYTKWVTDPEDPQVKAEAERRRQAGIKPPQAPIIEPVAHRPPSLARHYETRYAELLERFADQFSDEKLRPRGKHLVTSQEFDAALGL